MYNNYPITGRFRVCLELVREEKLKGKTLVDIGSSDGLLISKLKNSGLRKIIGVDPNENKIKIARKKNHQANFFVSTADNLPIKDNFADFATMFDVIEHVPKGGEVNALNEINRVLRPNGVLLLSTPNDNFVMNLLDPAWYLGHRHYKVNNLKRVLKKSGFQVISSKIKGGIWFSLYLIWLYFLKHVFKIKTPRSSFLEKKDDMQFNKNGIHTIFIIARKIKH